MRKVLFVSLLVALCGAVVPVPARAHTDQETALPVAGVPNSSYSAPVALDLLDGTVFSNPHFTVHLKDNTPLSQLASGPTSVTGSIEIDVALSPSGNCESNPTGPVDIRIRELNPDPALVSPWRIVNSFDKSVPCWHSERGETWHFEDSISSVSPWAREFELRLLDLMTGDVYVSAVDVGGFVDPKAPTGLAIASTSSIAVNVRWQDESLWENHLELQRALGTSTTWTTIDRITNAGRGEMTYQDYVPFPPSSVNVYRYRVRAVHGDTTSAWTPEISTG